MQPADGGENQTKNSRKAWSDWLKVVAEARIEQASHGFSLFTLVSNHITVAGILALPFRLEAVCVESHREAMKIIFTFCVAAICLTTHGQATKPLVPRNVYAHYLAMGSNIANLKTKGTAADLARDEAERKLKLQFISGQITGDSYSKAYEASKLKGHTESQKRAKEISALELKRLEIEQKFTLPVAAPDKPKPAQKTKPTHAKPASVQP